MGRTRVFVGFSSTDIREYNLMKAWKENNKIDFDFTDCQLHKELNSENEAYIKRKCRERIDMAGTFIQLIGEDTRYKYKYVRWEAEVAREKGCRIIGVNLNGTRNYDPERCPKIIRDIGAVFVSYSPAIISYALNNFKHSHDTGNRIYPPEVYRNLGYR
ncbi:TIR domain-containing protein [Alicyclobacillus fastidiosus]|uniref:TIR domain-containing protein n=1 Tax=Alicyclobacillus fastidiosus TaxID=392011 RepID=A0ABY6ZMA0_9BACL|nr:TIR domain-containing protein [Alicyclobacillus fastidiosus]WAH44014.1 TIR domain-containing protein [Alicyclobacillus fastidiosus]GMA60298.1 molecular chaperone Tir [Alicyclobacillus fastidiosus]